MLINHFTTIIFDLFHTLTSLEAVKAPGYHTSELLGVSREQWNEKLFQHSHDRLTGKVKDPYRIIESLAHRIDSTITSAIIREAVKNRNSRFKYALDNPDVDTLETLGKLKDIGKQLGLVSNADAMEKAGWNDSPLTEYFDCVVFSCDAGTMKPEHAIYRMCLQGLKAEPGDCLYAGDGSHDELMSAQDLGMTTVLVTHVIKKMWPERIPRARSHADYEIERISEILTIKQATDID